MKDKKCIHYKVCQSIYDGIVFCYQNCVECEFHKTVEEIAQKITENADYQRRTILCLNGLNIVTLTDEQWEEAKNENLKWIETIL